MNLTDSSGAIVKTYSYDAFGVEESIDSSDTNPFRYCGEYYDSEIEQIYLRARYYDPSLGRFTQQDPAMEDGYNWYVYCGNEPVNGLDPTGNHRLPITEEVNGEIVTTAEREDLRELLKQFGGVLKIDNGTIYMMALGGAGQIKISDYDDGEHLVNDHLHFSYGEFFELLGLDYEKTSVTVQVTQGEENKNRFAYAAFKWGQNIASGGTIEAINSIWGGFASVFGNLSGFIDDLMVNPYATPPVIPKGTYQINQYTVAGNVVQQRIGVSSGNNYYRFEFLWRNLNNPDYLPALLFGFERP